MSRRVLAYASVVLLPAFMGGVGRAQEPNQTPAQQPPPPAQAPAPAPLREPEILIPAGTTIPIALTTFLNSRSSQVGDTFYADTTYPIWVQQRLVIPRGSIVKGTVTHVERPGRIKGKGRIAIRFENVLLPNGVTRELVAELHGLHGPGTEKIDRKTETVEMGGSQGQDTAVIVGNAGEGAIIGAIAGRGAGAGIGAGAGAAVGLGTVLLTRGHDLVLEPGTQFDLMLRQPMRFPYGELEFTRDELSGAERTTRASQPRNRERNFGRGAPTRYPGARRYPIPWYTTWP